MTENQIPASVQKLIDTLESVNITVAEGDDGRFTGYSTEEPLFCVVRSSLDEIQAAVGDILKSYVETFYSDNKVSIHIVAEDVLPSTLPVENVRPVSRLRPSAPLFKGPQQPSHALG